MTNYLLSIDPSIKNTGFTLWENKIPILIESYSFNNKNKVNSIITNNFNDLINDFIFAMLTVKDNFLDENDINNVLNKLSLIIERGTFHSKNGIGYETQEHLRGFIAGQFNKLLTKDMLISNTEWWAYYEENYKEIIEILTHEIMNNFIKENNIKNININKKIYKKWIIYLKKELSFKLANYLKDNYNWEPIINNHDEADSLLIGWYYLNKEKK
ncbi:hypothetical protein [Spiroplasma endosymbiont of Aleiodes alternator]|uniref:hypothetical protein n=1 Tax=Spiroplasma endosymbiont of Aleiodes alternator TaxID=3139329 RepID=UPI003CCA9FA6